MRKTVVLLAAAAIVATLPSMASAAKRMRHYRPAPVADRSLMADALHQLVVPLEVTFAPRPAPRPHRHWRRRG